MTTSDALTTETSLLAMATRVGALAWLERRLFEVLGARAVGRDDVEISLVLAEHARHHAWRAEQLFARLPELRELPAADHIRPASAELVALLDELAGETSDATFVSVTYQAVLPALVGHYEAMAADVSPVADRSLARTVRLALADLAHDCAEGAPLVDRSGGVPEVVENFRERLVDAFPSVS